MEKMKTLAIAIGMGMSLAACSSEESGEPVEVTETVTSTVQSSDSGKTDTEYASEQLERMGITISPGAYSQIADIVCDGLVSQSSGSAMTDAVEEGVGLERAAAAKVVAAAAVFTCSDQARWLVR